MFFKITKEKIYYQVRNDKSVDFYSITPQSPSFGSSSRGRTLLNNSFIHFFITP